MRTLKEDLKFQYRLKNRKKKKQRKILIYLKLTKITFSFAITADVSSILSPDTLHLIVTITWHTHVQNAYSLSDKPIGQCSNHCTSTDRKTKRVTDRRTASIRTNPLTQAVAVSRTVLTVLRHPTQTTSPPPTSPHINMQQQQPTQNIEAVKIPK
jgi:hypothetical protein